MEISGRFSSSLKAIAAFQLAEPDDEEEYQLTTEAISGDCFRFSKRRLEVLPDDFLLNIQNIKFCYLDENELTALPEQFFQSLRQLEWLDLRKNNVEALPTAGLAGHMNLQVLLLQSNRIKNVPVELAEVPNLKGLQLAGNPVENIPFDVISQGFPGVKKFLKKQLKNTMLPVSETIITNNAPPTNSNSTIDEKDSSKDELSEFSNGKPKKKSRGSLSETLNVKSYNGGLKNGNSPKFQTWVKKSSGKNIAARTAPSCTARHMSSRQRMKSSSYKLVTLDQIYEQQKEDRQRAQLRETLEKQARILQRFKDIEAAKCWKKMMIKEGPRKLLDNFQYSPSKMVLDKTPFDVDPDMMQMLNRVDIYKSLKEWEEYHRRVQKEREPKSAAISVSDVEKKIKEIGKKLEEINIQDKLVKKDKSTFKYQMTSRIEEINKLRHALIKLHGENLKL